VSIHKTSLPFLHRLPLIRLFIFFLSGILFQIFNGVAVEISYSIIIITLIASIALNQFLSFKAIYRYSLFIHGLILVSAFFIGTLLVIVNTPSNNPNHYLHRSIKEEAITAKVKSHITFKDKTNKVLLEIDALIDDSGNSIPTNGKMLAYFKRDERSAKLRYNDHLLLFAKPSSIAAQMNPEEFDYREYSSFHGIYHQVYVDSASWTILEYAHGFSFYSWIIDQRNFFLNRLSFYLGTGQEYAVASALVIGFDEFLDKELIGAYATSGALHVLTVSGMHVGLIYMVLTWLLSIFKRFRMSIPFVEIIIVLLIWWYAMITGLAPSVQRASLMITILIIGNLLFRSSNVFNTMLVSAFVLLIINPYIITEVGFQLSFSAVFGIIFFYPKIKWIWMPPNKFLWWVWNLLCISFAAQLMTFPIGLLYFHMFPNLFIVSNLFVIPIASLVIYGVILLFIFGGISFIGSVLSQALLFLLKVLNAGVVLIDSFSFSLSDGIHITVAEALALYGSIFCLAFLLEQKKKIYFLTLIGFVILFVSGRIYLSVERLNKPKMIVYHVSNQLAIDFFSNKKHYFIYNNGLLNNESKMLFHIKHNWWKNGSLPDVALNLDSCKHYVSDNMVIKEELLLLGDKSILLVNKENQDVFNWSRDSFPLHVDYLLISNSPYLNIKTFEAVNEAPLFVFAAGNNNYKTSQWKQQLSDNNISQYDIGEKGAFVLY